MRISLSGALIAALTTAVLVGLIPAMLILDRRLAVTVEERAREELSTALRLLSDREAMSADMLTMHARDLARAPGLARALAEGAVADAVALAREAAPEGESPVLVDTAGRAWVGPELEGDLLQAVRRGRDSVSVALREGALLKLALSSVQLGGDWVGAAGVAAPLDQTTAVTLAGLTRADVIILAGDGVIASTLSEVPAALIEVGPTGVGGEVREIAAGENRFLVAAASLGEGTVLFVRDREVELAVVPELRKTVLFIVGAAVLVTILLGAVIAAISARPARALAHAAEGLAGGDFRAPVPDSAIREFDGMARAFAGMREALQDRLRDLEEANRELEDRQQRLSSLQTELIQRDRLAASGRLVAELAHEIRNPVANVRNCIEVIRRRLDRDERGLEFADLAIDELLRMHELAERMLDVYRPRESSETTCDVSSTVRDIASILSTGAEDSELGIVVEAPERSDGAIPPDALKQVLLNLVQNAREAMADHGTIEITVSEEQERIVLQVMDEGPGIAQKAMDRLFDPFFTTKEAMHGVGLGLFVAEGIVRRYGGRLTAENRTEGTGAIFRVELAAVSQPSAETAGGNT